MKCTILATTILEAKKCKHLIKPSFSIVTLILILSMFFLPIESFAQSNLRIFEDPGGGGSGTTQTEDSNDNTAIYVIGGFVNCWDSALCFSFQTR